MILLHAAGLGSNLYAWGEQSVGEAKKPKAKRGSKPKTESLRDHPQALSEKALIEAFADGSIAIPPGAGPAATIRAWLPTAGDLPLPSSPLIGDRPNREEPPQLAPWRIPVQPLDAAGAVSFLSDCAGRPLLAPGIAAAPDLAFWIEVLRFAGSIVARQRYLPDVIPADEGYQARWSPVLIGEEGSSVVRLARRMPPSARALAENGSEAAPSTAGLDVLQPLLAAWVDHLVRTGAAGEKPLRSKGRRKKLVFDSVHDAWLAALTSDDPAIHGDPPALADLAAQHQRWRRPLSAAAAARFKLCFRLEEPADSTPKPPGSRRSAVPEPWNIRYLLQPHDDPSLLIPVEKIWRKSSTEAKVVDRRDPAAREYVLSSLGQAASLCPMIVGSLETAKPWGYDLTVDGAHEFLTQKAAPLETAGFGVLLPAWWAGSGTRVRPVLTTRIKTPKMKAKAGLSLDSMVQFDWELALGGEKLTLKELETLVRLKTPLVKFRGQWVQINADEIRAAIEHWRKKENTTTLRDAVLIAIGAKPGPVGFESGPVEAQGWVEKLLGGLIGQTGFGERPVPAGFQGTLRPYQVRGFSWLAFLAQWGLGACLADDMGLGKTIQTLVWLEKAREEGLTQPALLVCPTSVVNNWRKEAEKFTPGLKTMVHHGVDRKKGASFVEEANAHALVISSYGLLQRDLATLGEISWGGVILDEAQNIRNAETKQAKAARSLPGGFRLALTGTPVENNVGDLWSIMEFINPGFLGTQADFRRGFFIPIQAGRDTDAAERLRKITGPFILRRLKTDKSIITDLPEKNEMKVFCSLTKEQTSLYAAVLKNAEEALAGAEGIARKGVILATLTKLKQVCDHPAHFLGDRSALPGRSGKLARLTEMIEEILQVGDRALIFTQFVDMGEMLQNHLRDTFGQEVLFLYGGLTRPRRDALIERFQNGKKPPPLFVLSLKAGGTGLNLTGANHVFHYDRWWNPAVENQATDRAFRIGQQKNVQVHKFICAGTLEEKIDEIIDRKRNVAENVVGTGEGWLTELSNDELRGILALRREALGE